MPACEVPSGLSAFSWGAARMVRVAPSTSLSGVHAMGLIWVDFSVSSVLDNSEARWDCINLLIESEWLLNTLPPIDLDDLL